MLAPRERTAWENLIKCVDGENCMMNCIGSGMLSNGVISAAKPPLTAKRQSSTAIKSRRRKFNRARRAGAAVRVSCDFELAASQPPLQIRVADAGRALLEVTRAAKLFEIGSTLRRLVAVEAANGNFSTSKEMP